jgi:hypothetical protein
MRKDYPKKAAASMAPEREKQQSTVFINSGVEDLGPPTGRPTSPKDALAEAKRRLPLPELMGRLGHGDRVKKSALCPFHEDSRPSFSVFQADGGAWLFKCHAGCGEGDEIDFLAKDRNLTTGDAIREFRRLAGGEVELSATPKKPTPPAKRFDWRACIIAMTPDKLAEIAECRGYSLEFLQWIHAKGMIGLNDGEPAFPVTINGKVVRCHSRVKDGGWLYAPKGRTTPLIFGEPATAGFILTFESQWDALGVMDRLAWHLGNGLPETAVIVTRGAQNGKFLRDHGTPDTVAYAFAQNDPTKEDGRPTPAEKWLADVIAHSPCNVIPVPTPEPYKDPNEWTKAGATEQDIWDAIKAAKPIESKLPAVVVIEAPDDDECDPPFPIEAFPPAIRDFVKAVADSERLPVILPAAVGLSVASAAVGAGLMLQSGPNRTARANLFLLISARSGLGKSTAFELLTGPLRDYESKRIEHWRTELAPGLQTEKRILEKEIANLEKQINPKTDEHDRAQTKAEMQVKQATLGEVVKCNRMPRLVTEDVTIETLPRLMEQNNETLYSQSSDARKVVQNLLGRYNPGKGTDDGFYLKAFTGEPFIEDRKDKDPIRLTRPCLSLLWLIQPDVLETLFNEHSLQVGGFLPRCLVAHTNAAASEISVESVSIPADLRAAWSGLIRWLLETFHGAETPQIYKPTPDASRSLVEHYNANVRRQNGDLRDVESFVSRWTEQAWRIAVTFHACKYRERAADRCLSEETAREAIAVADWFADRQLEILTKSRRASFKKQSESVIEFMKDRWERKKADTLKARNIYHDARICQTSEEARTLLALMESDGVLIGEDVRPARGGKTTRLYRLKNGPNPIPG